VVSHPVLSLQLIVMLIIGVPIIINHGYLPPLFNPVLKKLILLPLKLSIVDGEVRGDGI
jgi:hypothetical protein